MKSVDSLSTMGNSPNSDDLIRQAKESLASSTHDQEMPMGHPVEESDLAGEHQTVADRMYARIEADQIEADQIEADRIEADRIETYRVEEAPSEPAPFRAYPPKESVTGMPESSPGRGRGWRIIGLVILLPIAVLWALLLLAIALDPADAGEVIGGAVMLTAIPIGIGVFALKRAARS